MKEEITQKRREELYEICHEVIDLLTRKKKLNLYESGFVLEELLVSLAVSGTKEFDDFMRELEEKKN